MGMPKLSVPFVNKSQKAAQNLIYDTKLDLTSPDKRKPVVKPEDVSGEELAARYKIMNSHMPTSPKKILLSPRETYNF
jgi:hypothetical protein